MHARSQTQAGFTLIEAIVAIGLFTAVMVIAIGALLTVTHANRKAQAQREVIDNLTFILEDITRNVRTASRIGCGTTLEDDCVDDSIIIERYESGSPTPTEVEYSYNSSDRSILKNGVSLNPPDESVSNIFISEVSFDVQGSSPSDTVQPRVLITLKGIVREGTKFESFINVQTTIALRNIDDYQIVP